MNKTEEKARKWIISNFGLKESEVKFLPDAPEFIVKDGRRFAARRAYNGKTVMFYGDDYERIASYDKGTLLIFNEDDTKPMKQIAARNLGQYREGLDGIHFIHMKDRELPGGTRNGQIVIPLSKREENSRYYRVGHWPIESTLAWPRGEYELKKSVDEGNNLKFFMVLSPTEY